MPMYNCPCNEVSVSHIIGGNLQTSQLIGYCSKCLIGGYKTNNVYLILISMFKLCFTFYIIFLLQLLIPLFFQPIYQIAKTVVYYTSKNSYWVINERATHARATRVVIHSYLYSGLQPSVSGKITFNDGNLWNLRYIKSICFGINSLRISILRLP